MKELGYTQIKFKKNNGEWHKLLRTKLIYAEPYKAEQISFTYGELLNAEYELRERFHEIKDSIFPWGKKCLHWKNWITEESEWIYPGDTISFELDWVSENDISLYELMKKLSADDFIDYCKDKGISVSVNI